MSSRHEAGICSIPLFSFQSPKVKAFGPVVSHRACALRNCRSGGIYDAVLPDPIPNSEVKRVRANDSLAHASAKVGSCPLCKNSPNGEFLLLWPCGIMGRVQKWRKSYACAGYNYRIPRRTI